MWEKAVGRANDQELWLTPRRSPMHARAKPSTHACPDQSPARSASRSPNGVPVVAATQGRLPEPLAVPGPVARAARAPAKRSHRPRPSFQPALFEVARLQPARLVSLSLQIYGPRRCSLAPHPKPAAAPTASMVAAARAAMAAALGVSSRICLPADRLCAGRASTP